MVDRHARVGLPPEDVPVVAEEADVKPDQRCPQRVIFGSRHPDPAENVVIIVATIRNDVMIRDKQRYQQHGSVEINDCMEEDFMFGSRHYNPVENVVIIFVTMI